MTARAVPLSIIHIRQEVPIVTPENLAAIFKQPLPRASLMLSFCFPPSTHRWGEPPFP